MDEAVRNSHSPTCLFEEEMRELDGYMTLDELKEALNGVLTFPPDLAVENEGPLTLSFPTDLPKSGSRAD